MEEELIRKNIRFLIESKGITQEKLGKEIDDYKANQVNMWLKDRQIPEDILKKIANYFEVSMEVLKKTDIEQTLKDTPFSTNTNPKVVFPYIINKKAIEDDNFAKALELHERIFENDIIEDIYERSIECYDLYFKAYEQGIPESLVNMLSISCFYKFSSKIIDLDADLNEKEINNLKDFDLIEGNQKIGKKEKRDLLQKILVFNNSIKKQENENIIQKTTSEIIALLIELKKYPQFREEYDYYIAIMFAYNLISTDYEKNENVRFGEMYFDLIITLQNKHAINLYKKTNKKE